MNRPNILYIHSHDTGRYVQPYGHAVPTPNIQKFAEQGILFRQAFNAAPTCSPSRAALLTGQAPHSCGQFGLVNRGFELRDRKKHLAKTLNDAGYHTVVTGVYHVVSDVFTCGYAQHLPRLGKRDIGAATAAAEFLKNAPAEPFFLSVGFVATHRRYPEPDSEESIRSLPPAPIPDTPETRRDMAAFKKCASQLDRYVGTVLDALETSGLAENTLVILTTDHGIAFPKMKCNLTDHGLGVMLMLRGPGGFFGGKVCNAMVSHIDLYPTICELAGIDLPEWLQGRSMLPLINGDADEINDEIFAEVNYHCPYEPMRAVRTQRWKYIRRFHDYPTPMLSNCDSGASKNEFMKCGWGEQIQAREELYDLFFDPNEASNIATKPAMAEMLDEMRRRLNRWMESTDDPLLDGPIPPPPEAKINDPDDIEPQDLRN